ncbi:MAG: LamG-like jellyroll fold domain-containing protein [Massilia sp.]|uniref:LamG-like jellyroll fold domain-containing protein n=1 Tax=Massilia sp. TaxID=1882437 RepID=UPI002FC9C177
MFFRARRNGGGGSNVGRLFDKSAGISGQMAYWEAGAQSLTYHLFINGSERLVRTQASASASLGRDFDVLFTHQHAGSVSTVRIYIDGVLSVTQDFEGTLTDAPSATFNIGNRSDGARGWDGTIALVGACDRILSPDEARDISSNPWQLFADVTDEEYPPAAASYLLSVQPAAMTLAAGQVGMLASRRLSVVPAALTLATSDVALLALRRLGVLPAAMAITGGQVVGRVSRRLSVTPAAMAMTGRQVSMLYAPNPALGSYTLPVSAAAMTLTGGNVGMRVSRRLRVEPASLVLAGGAVRMLVGRRLMVSPAGLQLTGGTVTLRFSARGEPFDITKIHPSRVVIFEGSGSRVTPFEGSGSRVTPFGSTGNRTVRFE